MSLSHLLAAFSVTVALLPAGQARLPTPSMDVLTQTLETGDSFEKWEKVSLLLHRPAGTVTHARISLLAVELDRQVEILRSPTAPKTEFLGEYMNLLIAVLAEQGDPLAIPSLVRAIEDTGDEAFRAVIPFGAPAVDALVAGCRTNAGLTGHIKADLDALEQMLETSRIAMTFSDASHANIRAIASERIADPGGDPQVLIAAAYLAVATRSPKLRETVLSLVAHDAAELQKRDIDYGWHSYLADLVHQALEKFPLSR